MGGEIAAEALLEAVSRMIPGVVGNPESVLGDSFYQQDQFAFPQYTQPRAYRGLEVPEVLLSGDHKEIEKWRAKNRKTRRKKNEANS
jgi:tRNA (guanine37-N1)-methyltransferase